MKKKIGNRLSFKDDSIFVFFNFWEDYFIKQIEKKLSGAVADPCFRIRLKIGMIVSVKKLVFTALY